MFRKILIAIIVVIALLGIVITSRPSHFTIERSVEIDAPAEATFRYVNDPRGLNKWNPQDPGRNRLSAVGAGVLTGDAMWTADDTDLTDRAPSVSVKSV